MRSCFRKVVTSILFNQKRREKVGEVLGWNPCPLSLLLHGDLQTVASIPECLWKGNVMPQTGGVTQRLQDACFKESFTKLWKPWTWLPVTTAVCQGPLACPSTFTKSPRDYLLCLSSSNDTSPSFPVPYSGHFLLPLIFPVTVAQASPSPPPFLSSPLNRAPAPLSSCQGLYSIMVPPGPWATSSALQAQELQSSGKYHTGY